MNYKLFFIKGRGEGEGVQDKDGSKGFWGIFFASLPGGATHANGRLHYRIDFCTTGSDFFTTGLISVLPGAISLLQD